MKDISNGEDNFRTLREKDCLYVDKTPFIRELLANKSPVILLPRPRRFGKTLNMTMLHCFFDMTQDSRALFEGLAITHDADAMTHLNGYPTLFLSLKDLSQYTAWEPALVHLKMAITELYRSVKPLLAHLDLEKDERAYFEGVFEPGFSAIPVSAALFRLTKWLFQATGKKTVLLIDEYDTPIHTGLEHGYYEEVVHFLRGFLGQALKSNPYLERAVLTGILRIAKESIFSGLNNLQVHTILDEPFSTCFGFTEDEVEALVVQTACPHPMAEIRDWYNGYCFGKTTIYNPWSILNMLSRGDAGLEAHWVNTSGNGLILSQIQKGGCGLVELETLLRGGRIHAKLSAKLALRDMTPDSTWSLFLFAGYLTAENYNPREESADLYIPNDEVHRFFRDTVQVWLGSYYHSNALIAALLQGKLDLFSTRLQETVVTILSYHDTAESEPEQVFHVFILGLLAHLEKRYQVLSNRETGYGRADVLLIPKNPGQPAFLFEFKAAASPDSKTLRAAASAALKQSASRDYTAALRQAEVQTLYTIGLASHGKRLALASTVRTLPDGQASEPTYHLAGPEPEAKPRTRTAKAKKAVVSGGATAGGDCDHDHKIALIAQIQLLQELKGQTLTPKELLIHHDPSMLEIIVKGLKA